MACNVPRVGTMLRRKWRRSRIVRMNEDLLTEAARRAIEAAAMIAGRDGASDRPPTHLLWALFLEESRAAQMLKESGVTRDRLRAVSSLDPGDGLPGSLKGDEGPAIPDADAFRRVVAKATQMATLRGRSSQVGTDDLLLALASVDSAASRFLAQRGVTAATPEPDEGQKGGLPPEPIAVDFNIRWRDATEEDRTQTLRIVDAAANRAREGLRVLE